MTDIASLLKQTFTSLANRYSDDKSLTEKLWNEIQSAYSDKGRHYHTLSHLDNLLLQLEKVKAQINDWDVVLFALFYHDIIYKATSDKNEEKSAELARSRLAGLSFSSDRIAKCVSIILSTKGHTVTGDNDTDYFTDADLSILGQEPSLYSEYARQVRKEYSIYPDFVYNPGRKKVLNHFLDMPRIFKSQFFFDQFEAQARVNMMNERKAL